MPLPLLAFHSMTTSQGLGRASLLAAHWSVTKRRCASDSERLPGVVAAPSADKCTSISSRDSVDASRSYLMRESHANHTQTTSEAKEDPGTVTTSLTRSGHSRCSAVDRRWVSGSDPWRMAALEAAAIGCTSVARASTIERPSSVHTGIPMMAPSAPWRVVSAA